MKFYFWGVDAGVELNTVRTGNWTHHPMSERSWDCLRYMKPGAIRRAWEDITEEKPKMLDLTKKYRTRDGREVVGLCLLPDGLVCHSKQVLEGFVVYDGMRHRTKFRWWGNGVYASESDKHPLDLVPACEPITLGKNYQTAKGEAVELFHRADGRAWGRYFALRNGPADPAKYTDDGWRSFSWDVNDHTLQEVRKKITHEYWLGHYRDGVVNAYEYDPKQQGGCHFVAITGPHTVTFCEGEGLTAKS